MNTGRIIKRRLNKNYTVLDNELINSRELTLEEKGLMICLLSLPEDWNLYKNNLAKRLNEKEGKVDRVFKSLQEKGYILSTQLRNEKGFFKGWEHVVLESPKLKNIKDVDLWKGLTIEDLGKV
jgi:hypothetical protein